MDNMIGTSGFFAGCLNSLQRYIQGCLPLAESSSSPRSHPSEKARNTQGAHEAPHIDFSRSQCTVTIPMMPSAPSRSRLPPTTSLPALPHIQSHPIHICDRRCLVESQSRASNHQSTSEYCSIVTPSSANATGKLLQLS